MSRVGIAVVLPVVILITACSRDVQGPIIAPEPRVVTIVVEPLGESSRHPTTIVDHAIIEQTLILFAAAGWESNDDVLLPTHRIRLLRQDGTTLTYWVGVLSNPPRFPCYWFCTGNWVAAANPDGSLRPQMRKILATSWQMFVMGKLLDRPKELRNLTRARRRRRARTFSAGLRPRAPAAPEAQRWADTR